MEDLKGTLRIGVDVGGTNTDAVILDPSKRHSEDRGILAWHKTPTTSPNITEGITTVIQKVLSDSKISKSQVTSVTIGTTHFINAVVERDPRRLSKVAAIRISTNHTKDLPPLSDFPPVLKNIIYGYHCFVNGGIQLDGRQEDEINEHQIIKECGIIKAKGLNTIVITGLFSPIDMTFNQEDQVRKIVLTQIPNADIVCSAEVAALGILERENAAVLNASILKFARRTLKDFRSAMKHLELQCPLFVTQNDGTLIDASGAARLPIRTFSSGATNSMRGASYLGLDTDDHDTAKSSVVVIDIGGTTSDVGILLPSGYPREASSYTTLAGIRINYNMPHVESVGLGGGSIITVNKDEKVVKVGPQSVGYKLTTMAKVFGGTTLTATDIAVAYNPDTNIGDRKLVADTDPKIVKLARQEMKKILERTVDIMKISPDPLPVLLVGGGAYISPDELDGVSKVVRPPFFQVANAVGAAISKIGATVDIVQTTVNQSVAQALERAKRMATERALAAGAVPETISTTEQESIPLNFLPNTVRTIVRVVGDLSGNLPTYDKELDQETESDDQELAESGDPGTAAVRDQSEDNLNDLNIESYRPKVVTNLDTGNSEWLLTETDIQWIGDGCYILGCAGGGNPRAEVMKLKGHIRDGFNLRVIEASSLKDNASIYFGGVMGSPEVSIERIGSTEVLESIRELMYHTRDDTIDAVMCVEIGGGNGITPLYWGSSKFLDCPMVDADFMGRAFPCYYQNTLTAHEWGLIVPVAISSGDGKNMILTRIDNDKEVDRILRAPAIEFGCFAGTIAKVKSEHVKRYGVLNTVSSAWRIGRCIARARRSNAMNTVSDHIIDELGGPGSAKLLFRGKIVGIERKLVKGHSYGEIVIEHVPGDETAFLVNAPTVQGGKIMIPFQNENIFAKHLAENGDETYLATVPDLISVVDAQTGTAVGVPDFKYGVMVFVLGITASTRWTQSPRGLEIGGPQSFGFDIPYKSVGTYVEPKSVIEEFR